jgi:hypothetical protein
MTEKLWTLKELVENGPIKKSIATWRRMVAQRKIEHRRVGSGRGLIYIPDSAVRRLIKSGQI